MTKRLDYAHYLKTLEHTGFTAAPLTDLSLPEYDRQALIEKLNRAAQGNQLSSCKSADINKLIHSLDPELVTTEPLSAGRMVGRAEATPELDARVWLAQTLHPIEFDDARRLSREIDEHGPVFRAIRFFEQDEVKDEDFPALLRLDDLSHLDLGQCDELGPESWSQLASMKNLEELNMEWCSLDDQLVDWLRPCPKLRSVNLRQNNDLSDNGLTRIAQLRTLRHLDISECHKISRQGLRALMGCPNLSSLRLRNLHELVRSSHEDFAMFPKLRRLFIDRCAVDERVLVALGDCPNLEYIDLEYSQSPGERGFKALAQLRSLTGLNLGSNDQIQDSHIIDLSQCQSLKSLQLRSCRSLGEDAFAALAKLSNLRFLDLEWSKIEPNGLLGLANLPRLEYLNIENCEALNRECVQTFIQRLGREVTVLSTVFEDSY